MKKNESLSNKNSEKKSYEKPTLKVEVSFNTSTWGDETGGEEGDSDSSDLCSGV